MRAVAFPGGMRDDDDASLHITALREAHEEIGLRPRDVRIIGTLPVVSSSTGFQVTPVVGLIPPDLPRFPNAEEVDAILKCRWRRRCSCRVMRRWISTAAGCIIGSGFPVSGLFRLGHDGGHYSAAQPAGHAGAGQRITKLKLGKSSLPVIFH